MNDSQKRVQWQFFDDIHPFTRPDGRTRAGAQNHCAHGKDVTIETILDWRPFEYYTVEYPMAVQSQHLESISDGTLFNVTNKLKMPLPGWITRPLANFMFKLMKSETQFDKLARLVEKEVAQEELKR